MTLRLRIATRRSALALWQARHVQDLLRQQSRGLAVELIEVVTSGDARPGEPSAEMTGTGWFTKEVQQAVLENRADLAVHSLKDLPTEAPPGLVLAAVPKRGPWADVFVSLRHERLDELPAGAAVATGSPRRRAQLLRLRPDLQIPDLRGNVDSRLRKLETEGLAGIVLAEAGLVRLGLSVKCTQVLSAEQMLPAAGQGALGIECRAADRELRSLLGQLDHFPSSAAAAAERAVLRRVGGGCRAALGVLAEVAENQLTLRAAIWTLNGQREVREHAVGQLSVAAKLGEAVGLRLRAGGAGVLPDGP